MPPALDRGQRMVSQGVPEREDLQINVLVGVRVEVDSQQGAVGRVAA
jgi:hypothetical protein